jgi:hypothetical protein
MGLFATYVVGVSLGRDLCDGSLKNALVSKNTTPENKSLEEQLDAPKERLSHAESSDVDLDFKEDSALGPVDLFGDYTVPKQLSTQVPKKIGAPHKMTKETFERQRDDYVIWVEALWPEFEEVSSPPGDVGEFQQKLLYRFMNRDGDMLFRMLLANVVPLHEYLTSKSNTGEPRRMAYVLAGLSGGLTWRYSLERCRKNPSSKDIGFRAMREHIQRCHPAWYRDLTAESSQAKAIAKIPRNCPECERFKKRPDQIIQALQVRPSPRTANPESGCMLASDAALCNDGR